LRFLLCVVYSYTVFCLVVLCFKSAGYMNGRNVG